MIYGYKTIMVNNGVNMMEVVDLTSIIKNKIELN